MTNHPRPRTSPGDLDSLLGKLEVRCVALTECLVDAGFALTMAGARVPGIHYNLTGHGQMSVGDSAPFELRPHTLVIVPPHSPFRIECAGSGAPSHPLKVIDGRAQVAAGTGEVRRVSAGGRHPEIILICGFFDAEYGSAVQLFGTLSKPIVEQFDSADGLDHTLKTALPVVRTRDCPLSGTRRWPPGLLATPAVAVRSRRQGKLS